MQRRRLLQVYGLHALPFCLGFAEGTAPQVCYGAVPDSKPDDVPVVPNPKSSGVGIVTVILITLVCLSVAAVAAYALYRYRLRHYMDGEIRAIMSQYMPLDARQGQAEGPGNDV